MSEGFKEDSMVKSSNRTLNTNELQADREEVDTRTALHYMHTDAVCNMMSAQDTEVLLVTHYDKMYYRKLWTKDGTSKKQQQNTCCAYYLRATSACISSGRRKNTFHSLRGYGIFSLVSENRKKTTWTIFMKKHGL